MKHTSVLLLMPAIRQAANAGARAEARQNCALVTIAVYRYRHQHGTLPRSLNDLKDLISVDVSNQSSRLIDPFDDQPLRFKSETGRVLIYSIGDNKLDDGGDIANKKPLEGDLGYLIAE